MVNLYFVQMAYTLEECLNLCLYLGEIHCHEVGNIKANGECCSGKEIVKYETRSVIGLGSGQEQRGEKKKKKTKMLHYNDIIKKQMQMPYDSSLTLLLQSSNETLRIQIIPPLDCIWTIIYQKCATEFQEDYHWMY